MTLIQGCGCPCRERTFEGSSPPPESIYDKTPVNPPAEPLVTKYTEKDLQRIRRTVLEAQAPPFDDPRKKLLKARLPDVYRGNPIWNAITFASRVRTTLPLPEPRAPTAFLLQHPSYMIASTSVGSNTSGSMRPRAQSLLLGRSSRPFFVKA